MNLFEARELCKEISSYLPDAAPVIVMPDTPGAGWGVKIIKPIESVKHVAITSGDRVKLIPWAEDREITFYGKEDWIAWYGGIIFIEVSEEGYE